MIAGKMHDDELDTNAALVRRLLKAQFPQWADLPIEHVRSAGTGNACAGYLLHPPEYYEF